MPQTDIKLGIIAGGQLAKMLVQEASKLAVETWVLDPDADCPAAAIASVCIQGHYNDYDSVLAFGRQVDLLTFEIEHVNTAALYQLQAEGLAIAPDPSILELIQDKGRQKAFYRDHDIPTAPFTTYPDQAAIRAALAQGSLTYPFVQKLCRGGYDGRGVAVIAHAGDLDSLLDGPSIIEPRVAIAREVAVITARDAAGGMRSFPPVDMVFDPRANLVDKLVSPSAIDAATAARCTAVAEQLAQALDLQGLLAVELFIDTAGSVLVNESAPRPHNSGHHTIESVYTSQFEQHLRAVLGLPLGSTRLKTAAVMVNLLGAEGYAGPAVYDGLADCLAIEGVHVHIYGKRETRPYRKMGHVTVIAPTAADALAKAESVKPLIEVKA